MSLHTLHANRKPWPTARQQGCPVCNTITNSDLCRGGWPSYPVSTARHDAVCQRPLCVRRRLPAPQRPSRTVVEHLSRCAAASTPRPLDTLPQRGAGARHDCSASGSTTIRREPSQSAATPTGVLAIGGPELLRRVPARAIALSLSSPSESSPASSYPRPILFEPGGQDGRTDQLWRVLILRCCYRLCYCSACDREALLCSHCELKCRPE